MKIKIIAKCFLLFLCSAATLSLGQVQASSIQQESEFTVFGNSLTQSFQSGSSEFAIKQAQHRFVGESSSGDNITAFNFTQNVAGNGVHLSFSQGKTEQHAVLGYSLGRFTFSAIRGKAQSFIRDAGSFQGIDRFSFHGGNDIGFDYFGAALDTKLNSNLHAQFGFAQLDSKFLGLQSRGVQYFELSSNAQYKGLSGLYGRISFFERGDESIGQGLETGFAYKNAHYTFQALSVNGNKKLFRLRSQYALSDATSLLFDISQANDPSHFDESRYTSMLSIQHFIGKKSKIRFNLKEEAQTEVKKKSRISRPVLIGAGVVAVAAIASSGSSSSDSSTRSQAETDAAFAVLNRVNPQSIRENREFGGWIYRNQDNTFGSSTPVRGGAASVTLPSPAVSTPIGSTVTASYHTHAAFDPRFDNENFSPQDIAADNSVGIGGYLGTPGGTFQYHFGDDIELLGSLATQ